MTPQQQKLIAEEAARWMSRLETGSSAEQAAFAAWLRASPQHIREFLVLTALEKEIDAIELQDLNVEQLLGRCAGKVVPISHSPTDLVAQRPQIGKPRRAVRFILAAAIAGAVAVLGFVAMPQLTGLGGAVEYATVVGEQRAVELADGSVVRLNPLSRVRVSYSEEARDILLVAGEAIFKVETDPARPFRVSSGGAVIQAIGTQFHVYQRSSGTVVSVIEGVVQISSSGDWSQLPRPSDTRDLGQPTEARLEFLRQPARLRAGEEARIAADGSAMRRLEFDPTQRVAWRERQVIFNGDTLADIAEDFNRYNRTPRIRIEGEGLSGRRYSGAFDADDPESLVEYLRRDGSIAVDHLGEELVVRER